MKQICDENSLNRMLRRLSHEISEKNEGLDDIVLIGIRTRGVYVAKRIQSILESSFEKEVPLGILDITLYRDDILNCNSIAEGTEIECSLEGKTVILCDDVLCSGRTVRAAISAMFSLSSKMGRMKKIQLLEIIDRGHRELPFRADYIGKNIPTSKEENVLVHFKEVDGEDGIYIS